MLAGRPDVAGDLLDAVRTCADDRTVKVIIESGELPADRVADATRLAIAHGADFVKTSTGKTPVGATIAAVEVIAEVIAAVIAETNAGLTADSTAGRNADMSAGERRDGGRTVGIKASGGIRTFADATRYVETVERRLGVGWATPATFRFGASALLADLLAHIGR
jgi:deoxyribose-phosphate aldolase